MQGAPRTWPVRCGFTVKSLVEVPLHTAALGRPYAAALVKRTMRQGAGIPPPRRRSRPAGEPARRACTQASDSRLSLISPGRTGLEALGLSEVGHVCATPLRHREGDDGRRSVERAVRSEPAALCCPRVPDAGVKRGGRGRGPGHLATGRSGGLDRGGEPRWLADDDCGSDLPRQASLPPGS